MNNFHHNQQQPQQHQPSITGAVSTTSARAPLMSTAGYSIQESRRRMLETIDRRRNEMLSQSAAAAAAAAAMNRGPQIGSVGSAAAPTGLLQMPRLQQPAAAAAASALHYQSATTAAASVAAAAAAAAAARHRSNGFVSSFPTPNGGAFTHMKFPPGRGGSMIQQQQQAQQQQHRPGSMAAVPGGAIRAMAAAAAAAGSVGAIGSNNNNSTNRPSAGVVRAPADSTAYAAGVRRDRTRVRQQAHHHHQQQSMAASSTTTPNSNNVPNHTTQMPPAQPDVSLQPHAFFAVVAEVMRPTSLLPLRLGHRMQAAELSFTLTQEQAETVAMGRVRNPATQRTEYAIQVQLRCCKIGAGPQPDCFPPGVSLAVNKNQVTSLPPPVPSNKPNADPIRPGRPVNISGHCRISHAVLNRLTLTWLHDPNVPGYCVSVALVRPVSVQQLAQGLLASELQIAAAATRARVVELLGGEGGGAGGGAGASAGAGDELRMTDLTASLRCPLTRSRIVLPARGAGCSHLQCFDAAAYLAMNERRPAWRCPCCDRSLPLGELRIDGLFRQVLDSTAAAATPVDIVRFLPNGAWVPATQDGSHQQQQQQQHPQQSEQNQCQTALDSVVVDLTDDAPVVSVAAAAIAATATTKRPAASAAAATAASVPEQQQQQRQSPDIVVITLDSSDDDEADTVPPVPPPAKRHRPAGNPSGNPPGSPKIAGNRPGSPRIAGNPGSPKIATGNPSGSPPGSPKIATGNPSGNPPGSPKIATGNPSGNPSSTPAVSAASSSSSSSSSGLAASGFSGGPIPLPTAFLQDQQRLSALLSGVGPLRRLQQQQQQQGSCHRHGSPSTGHDRI